MTDMESACLSGRSCLLREGCFRILHRVGSGWVLAAPELFALDSRTLLPHYPHLCTGYGCSLLGRCKLSVLVYLSGFSFKFLERLLLKIA